MSSNNNDCISINRLAFTVAQSKPSSTHVIVYFDQYEQSCNDRIDIIPLKIVAISDKKRLSCVDKLFPEIHYISIPKFYRVTIDTVEGALYKILIEVNESKFDRYDYHKAVVYPVFNKAFHDMLNPCNDLLCSSEDVANLDYDPCNDPDLDPRETSF